VDETFHARFSAQERRYLFRILVRRAPVTHQAGLVWNVKKTLDLDAMREGADHLLGRHDFTTFRSTICQSITPIKTVDRLDMQWVDTTSGPELHFDVRARSFLHNQVRSFVGTLERVGAGSLRPDDVKKMRDARDRQACGPVSPPHGLYLSHVGYPVDPFAA
jgi:tRNA pseudouridine38-40 synthase